MKNKKRLFSLGGLLGVLFLLITTGAFCIKGDSLTPPSQITLKIWRSADKSNTFDAAIKTYQAVYPHVKFEVKVFQKDEYEDALIASWAKGEGPDIFSVPNWRLGKFKQFIAAMPTGAVLRTAHEQKTTFGAKTVVEERTLVFPKASRLYDLYPEAVVNDVVDEDKIYGLPLSLDTLSLYYNRDILARAKIAVPPENWSDFITAVKAITVKDQDNNIVQPATAMGTVDNVPHFFDLVSVLMMQNGTVMTDDRNTTPLFNQEDPNQKGTFPGVKAVEFYRDFSNTNKEGYTWNNDQPDALEVFTQGNLAFYFGYHDELTEISQRAPDLKFSQAKLPQVNPGSPVDYANYSVETVYAKSPNIDQAWNFINFLTSAEQAKSFSESTGKIPALRSLLNEKKDDPEISLYVEQALTAKSWYHGYDPDKAKQAFADMIIGAQEQTSPLSAVVNLATEQVELTMEEKKL
ncbi:MAG: hypothetical protein A2233_01015 [Candidatus Kerfeldbacteria bacterium RIFOXYA2_FULL_38_24]|uniref:Sugar ABC transporter substrate-binding protein n=1 Tax=Candidatus Kerfeldbacteria bacterium RIFOXYB2_FULL_38_14 TaxID=1798547 RepID=A0A1G2BE95_9BACT|nr:MAG: hypothetical protein A2233_01015 [Candidatus Kerfeldbacteria bacterium RIFOXYA2_FULL_38_24]OGY86517.1 MAG: hypothetical protein A2319_02005 [Candidatus Kerfeldbacteria bacterium RIFOXYB2_FULL_38_14]